MAARGAGRRAAMLGTGLGGGEQVVVKSQMRITPGAVSGA